MGMRARALVACLVMATLALGIALATGNVVAPSPAASTPAASSPQQSSQQSPTAKAQQSDATGAEASAQGDDSHTDAATTPDDVPPVAEAEAAIGMKAQREGIDYAAGHVLVGLPVGTTTAAVDALKRDAACLSDEPLTTSDFVTCQDVDGTLVDDNGLSPVVTLPVEHGVSVVQALYELKDDPRIESVSDDSAIVLMDDQTTLSEQLMPMAETPSTINDARRSEQWALGTANLYQAWSLSRCDGSGGVAVGDKSVSIAVIDTGTTEGHEDLAPNIIDCYDSYNADKGGSTTTAIDGDGHGTHVTGIASAATNNGLGISGSSYNARIVAVKATDSNGNYDSKSYRSHVISALNYVMTKARVNNTRVVNFSAGLKYLFHPYNWEGDEFCKRITQARQNGILFVAAAGNQMNGATVPYWEWPGDYDDCLSVMNATRTGGGYTRSDSSNYNRPGISRDTPNETKDITAPGASILSTLYASPWYGTKSGTSMASPLVAGIAALCFAEDPTLTPDDVQSLLQNTANPAAFGETGWSREYGYGMVDAYAAVSHIMSNVSVADIPDQTTDGQNPAQPAVTITNADGRTLLEGTDYTVSYEDNDHVGTATATISGIGSYVGKVTKTFQVAIPCDVNPVDVVYDGKAHTPSVETDMPGAEVRFSSDGGATYTLEEPPSYINAGTYDLCYAITYEDEVAYGRMTSTIRRRSVTLTSASASKVYDGRPLTAQRVDVGGAGWAAGQGATYSYTGTQTNAGTSANRFSYTLLPGTSTGNYQITTHEGTLTVTYQGNVMYRLYNPNSGEHFYTANRNERDAVRNAGWNYEGHAWTAPAKSPTPVWRLYNANAGDHHYTASKAEHDSLVRVGWKSEGIGWYSGGNVPLWRQYNPNAVAGSHNYTTSGTERRSLIAAGWKDEGVAWYGM